MAVGLLSKCVFHWVVDPFPGGGKVVGGRRSSAVVGRRPALRALRGRSLGCLGRPAGGRAGLGVRFGHVCSPAPYV